MDGWMMWFDTWTDILYAFHESQSLGYRKVVTVNTIHSKIELTELLYN
jgi:hypothetical protein